MSLAAAFLVPLILVSFSPSFADDLCLQTGPCSCRNSQGTIDLKPLAKNDSTPRFMDIADPTTNYWRYSYNPCKAFNEGSCNRVVVCQSNRFGTYYPIGDPTPAAFVFDVDKKVNSIKYSSTDTSGTTRTSIVTLQCDQNQEGTFSFKGQDNIGNTYRMTLTSKYACYVADRRIASSLSGGSILLIAFFALVILYFIGGVIFTSFVSKASGKEGIPNVTLWTSLPGLIKDGTMFVLGRKRREYSSI